LLIDKTRVCFVCLGNIVRSPLAENLFKHQLGILGIQDQYQVDSAGISAWHIGERPDPRMRQIAASRGIHYDGRARQILEHDVQYFDYLIAMDEENYNDLKELVEESNATPKIHLLRDFDPETDGDFGKSVPDPYYAGRSEFEVVYTIIERSVSGLVAHLEGIRS